MSINKKEGHHADYFSKTRIRKISKNLVIIRWKGWIPRLALHEKYQVTVRWSLRVVVLIGIVISVLSFPWYQGLLLALGLLLLEQFFERSVFLYTSMYIPAMPNFELDPEKWISMAFVMAKAGKEMVSIEIGLVFNDEEYAMKFFDLLRTWNYEENEDKDDNIALTFVIDEDQYFVYLYPRPTRESVTKFFSKVEESNKFDKYGKEHFGIVLTLMICKRFSTQEGYSLGTFLKNKHQESSFLLKAYKLNDEDKPIPIDHISPIKKWHLKEKTRVDLNEEDLEYFHLKETYFDE